MVVSTAVYTSFLLTSVMSHIKETLVLCLPRKRVFMLQLQHHILISAPARNGTWGLSVKKTSAL